MTQIEKRNLSSSEEACSPAPLGAATSVVVSTSETEDEDEMMRHSPERMMTLSINHNQIYPKLHQLVDRIVAGFGHDDHTESARFMWATCYEKPDKWTSTSLFYSVFFFHL